MSFHPFWDDNLNCEWGCGCAIVVVVAVGIGLMINATHNKVVRQEQQAKQQMMQQMANSPKPPNAMIEVGPPPKPPKPPTPPKPKGAVVEAKPVKPLSAMSEQELMLKQIELLEEIKAQNQTLMNQHKSQERILDKLDEWYSNQYSSY